MKNFLKLLSFCLILTVFTAGNITNASALTSTNKVLYIHADLANIRSGAGAEHKITTTSIFRTKVTASNYVYNKKKELWFYVQLPDKKRGWVNSKYVSSQYPAYRPIHAPHILQMPELARGCEVTSLAMMLNHAGKPVNKMTLAKEVKKDPTPYKKKNGKVYFGNPHVGFVGNMYTFKKSGYGVYHKPIEDLARKYIGKRVVNLTGKSFNEVKKQLNKRKPVWVIVNSQFSKLSESSFQYYHTPQGPIKITYREHSVLLTGYEGQYIYVNDPLSKQKNRKLNMKHFIAGWDQMGKQAISYN